MSRTFEIQIAKSYGQEFRAEFLIADIYNRHYDIVFSRDMVDLDAKIEPYPDHYLIGTVDGEVVAAAGLYTEGTYVEKYGNVSRERLQEELERSGAADRFDPSVTVEVTKLVIHPDWSGYGLGRELFCASYSKDFLMCAHDRPPLVLCCATQRIFESLHHSVGMHTRPLGLFPEYEVHERYRTPENPMDSRLILPGLDIPANWWDNPLPRSIPLPEGS